MWFEVTYCDRDLSVFTTFPLTTQIYACTKESAMAAFNINNTHFYALCASMYPFYGQVYVSRSSVNPLVPGSAINSPSYITKYERDWESVSELGKVEYDKMIEEARVSVYRSKNKRWGLYTLRSGNMVIYNQRLGIVSGKQGPDEYVVEPMEGIFEKSEEPPLIHPAPVTEDILTAFGFNKMADDRKYDLNQLAGDWLIRIGNHLLFLRQNEAGKADRYKVLHNNLDVIISWMVAHDGVVSEISNAHELQNIALYLTGNELNYQLK